MRTKKQAAPQTKTYKGITYTRVLRFESTTRYKWDGGELGGIVFELEHPNGTTYGVSGLMRDNFEKAAEEAMVSRRHRYQQAKAITDAYEKAERALANKIMRELAGDV